jgi:hypothetical protein
MAGEDPPNYAFLEWWVFAALDHTQHFSISATETI